MVKKGTPSWNKGRRWPAESIMKMSDAKRGSKNPFYGKHWRESSKEKWRRSRAWYKHSEETREKIRQSRIEYYKLHPEAIEQFKGRNNPMFGKRGSLNPMFGRRLSADVRKKLSEARLGKYTGAKNPFYGKRHSAEIRAKMKESWKHRAFPEKDNKLELKLQQALISKGVAFQKHAQITGRPDLFLQPNICIFIDGCYWHGCACKFDQNWSNPHAVYIKTRIVHDAKVNEELRAAGFLVLRFKEHEIMNDTESCTSVILKTINKPDKNESS